MFFACGCCCCRARHFTSLKQVIFGIPHPPSPRTKCVRLSIVKYDCLYIAWVPALFAQVFAWGNNRDGQVDSALLPASHAGGGAVVPTPLRVHALESLCSALEDRVSGVVVGFRASLVVTEAGRVRRRVLFDGLIDAQYPQVSLASSTRQEHRVYLRLN